MTKKKEPTRKTPSKSSPDLGAETGGESSLRLQAKEKAATGAGRVRKPGGFWVEDADGGRMSAVPGPAYHDIGGQTKAPAVIPSKENEED